MGLNRNRPSPGCEFIYDESGIIVGEAPTVKVAELGPIDEQDILTLADEPARDPYNHTGRRVA